MIKHVITSQTEMAPCCHEECIDLLSALSDVNRQAIVALFYSHRELCVNDIAEHFKLSRPTISHHLILMKRAKLLNSRKEGKEVFYSLNREYVIEMLETVLDSFKKCDC